MLTWNAFLLAFWRWSITGAWWSIAGDVMLTRLQRVRLARRRIAVETARRQTMRGKEIHCRQWVSAIASVATVRATGRHILGRVHFVHGAI